MSGERLGIGERRDVVLQLAQLGDDVLGDEVGARRADLAELDERRAEPLEGVAQPQPERLAGVVLGPQPPVHRREPAQTRDVERVVEALVDEDADDLAVSLEVLVRRHPSGGGRSAAYSSGLPASAIRQPQRLPAPSHPGSPASP